MCQLKNKPCWHFNCDCLAFTLGNVTEPNISARLHLHLRTRRVCTNLNLLRPSQDYLVCEPRGVDTHPCPQGRTQVAPLGSTQPRLQAAPTPFFSAACDPVTHVKPYLRSTEMVTNRPESVATPSLCLRTSNNDVIFRVELNRWFRGT